MAKDSFYNKLWFWLLILIFLITIIFLIFNTQDTSFPKNKNNVTILEESCKDINLTESYMKLYGDGYPLLELNCERVGTSIWTEEYNEVSCKATSPITFSCDDFENTAGGEDFIDACVLDLKADFVCIDDYYVGCVCDEHISKPSSWTENDCGDGIDNDNDNLTDCEDPDCDCDFCSDKEPLPYDQLNGFIDAEEYCSEKTLCYDEECYPYLFGDEIYCGCSELPYCFEPYVEYFYTECICPPNHEQQWTSRSTFRCIPNLWI